MLPKTPRRPGHPLAGPFFLKTKDRPLQPVQRLELGYRVAMRPPSTTAFLGELGTPIGWLRGQFAAGAIARRNPGDGRKVLVLPGFLAGDGTTATLRRTLNRAGYRAHGWELGRNVGVSDALLGGIEARLAEVRGDGGKVVLIGWSLGGLYAREIAKRQPESVERVVTLGTPFSGDPRSNNNMWRLYERVAGHGVDRPPIDVVLHEKPPVPTFALWSPRDGIVTPAASRGQPGETDAAIRVDCLHIAFTSAPEALSAILQVLARPV